MSQENPAGKPLPSGRGAVTLNRKKLAQICGMLASDNEQERASAAKAASAMIAESGSTWLEVITGESHRKEGARPQPAPASSPFSPGVPRGPVDPARYTGAFSMADYMRQQMELEVKNAADRARRAMAQMEHERRLREKLRKGGI